MAKIPVEYDDIKDYVVRGYFELTAAEGTYAANQGMSNSTTISVAKAGYKAIGIVGLYGQGSGIGNFTPTLYTIDTDTQQLIFYGKNTSSSSITVTKYYAYILYVRNT